MSTIKNFVLVYLISFCSELVAQWELRYPDFPTDNINDIVFINDQKGFIVNDGGSVLLTTDGGLNWNIQAHYQRNTFAEIKFVDDLNGFSFSPHGYIGDDVQFIYTNDGGISWDKASVYLSNALTFQPISTSMLLKSVDDGTIMKLDNFYGNWMETFRVPYFFDEDLMVPYGFINQFQKFGNGKILALGSSGPARDHNIISDSVSYILKSFDNGTTWDTLWCDLTIAANIFFFVDSMTGWFGGEKNYLYKTTNGGVSWIYQFSDTLLENKITSIHATDNMHVFAVNEIGTFYSSSDGGINWSTYQLPDSYWWKFTVKFINDQKGFITGTDFWVTNNGGISWERVSNCIKDDIWEVNFVNLNVGWASGTNGIYKTSNGGYDWELQLSSPGYFYSIDMLDSLIGWATSDQVHKTTDGGTTWETFSLGNTISLIRGVHFLDYNVGIIYEVWDWAVDSTINFVTTDGGNTWTRYVIQNYQYVSSYSKMKFTDAEHLWFVNQQGVWLSQDTGKTWTLNETINSQFGVFDFLNSQICWLQEEHENIAFTTNGGNFWERMDTPYDVQGIDMEIIGRDYFGNLYTLLCGFYGSLIEFIEDPVYGTYINTSYTQNSLNSISKFISGSYADIWVAGNGFTILNRTEFVSDVPTKSPNLVREFYLSQNYPNPFNPSTVISYQLPVSGDVTLKVYDILGNEVATLVNEEKAAGIYNVEFRIENLPAGRQDLELSSGIYFYQLKAGSYTETKKMVLLK